MRKNARFQFLIGTLKTNLFLAISSPPLAVSIPHRYAKNSENTDALGSQTPVSIPHRYAKNAPLHDRVPVKGKSFNSS